MGRLAILLFAWSLVGCAAVRAPSLHPAPLQAARIDRAHVGPGGRTPRFIVSPDGSAVGLVYYARWVNMGGVPAHAFVVARRQTGWVAHTEVLLESRIAGEGLDFEPLDVGIAATGVGHGAWWWTLAGRSRIPRVRVEVNPDREPVPAETIGWSELGSRNPDTAPWFVDAVRASSIVAARVDPAASAAALAQPPLPELEPGVVLAAYSDGQRHRMTLPARLTGESCPLPLHSPVAGARVVRPSFWTSPYVAVNERGTTAVVFGVDSCADAGPGCERRQRLFLGLCGVGWRTLELGDGQQPAVHIDPDGTVFVASSSARGIELVTVTDPELPRRGWTPLP